MRRGTSYTLTNKRVLIQRSPPFRKLITLQLSGLSELSLDEGGNGRGTIKLGPQTPTFSWGYNRNNNNWSALTPALGPDIRFLGIENVRDVFRQIQSAKDRLDSDT